MSPLAYHFLHQAFFGGTAAAGFGVLFNCPPRSLWLGFTFGALALVGRTAAQEIGGLGLPAASFIAALILAVLNRILEQPDSPRGSVLAVIGCIPMIPGSLAAKGLMHRSIALSPNKPVQLGPEADEPLRSDEGDSWRGVRLDNGRR